MRRAFGLLYSVAAVLGLFTSPGCAEKDHSPTSAAAPEGLPAAQARAELSTDSPWPKVHFTDRTTDPSVVQDASIPDFILQIVDRACAAEVFACISTQNFCKNDRCVARGSLCKAHYLAEIATVRAQPLSLVGLGADALVPAQTTETSAALMIAAAVNAQEAVHWARDALAGATSLDASSQCTVADGAARSSPEDPTWLEKLGNAYVEAYDLVHETLDEGVTRIVAVADARRADTPTLADAVARSLTGARFSRSQ